MCLPVHKWVCTGARGSPSCVVPHVLPLFWSQVLSPGSEACQLELAGQPLSSQEQLSLLLQHSHGNLLQSVASTSLTEPSPRPLKIPFGLLKPSVN